MECGLHWEHWRGWWIFKKFNDIHTLENIALEEESGQCLNRAWVYNHVICKSVWRILDSSGFRKFSRKHWPWGWKEGHEFKRYLTLPKSIPISREIDYSEQPDQEHVTAPNTRCGVNHTRIIQMECDSPSLPFWGKRKYCSRNGNGCWASKTTYGSHNLLLVLEQQPVCWMKLLDCSPSEILSHICFSVPVTCLLVTGHRDFFKQGRLIVYIVIVPPSRGAHFNWFSHRQGKNLYALVCIHSVNSIWLMKCLLNNSVILAILFMRCAWK